MPCSSSSYEVKFTWDKTKPDNCKSGKRPIKIVLGYTFTSTSTSYLIALHEHCLADQRQLNLFPNNLQSDITQTQATRSHGCRISASSWADTSWGTRASEHSHKVRANYEVLNKLIAWSTWFCISHHSCHQNPLRVLLKISVLSQQLHRNPFSISFLIVHRLYA